MCLIWKYMGDVEALRRAVPIYLEECVGRGDRLEEAHLRGEFNYWLRLLDDDGAAATEELHRVRRRWPGPDFHVQRYWLCRAEAEVALYQGRAHDARARLLSDWRLLDRNLFRFVQSARVEAWEARGRVTLASAALCSGRQRRLLLDEVQRTVAQLRREDVRWSRGQSLLLQAGVEELRGDTTRALETLRSAEERLGADGLALHELAAAHGRARMLGKQADCAGIEVQLRQSGVAAPERFMGLLTPGRGGRQAPPAS